MKREIDGLQYIERVKRTLRKRKKLYNIATIAKAIGITDRYLQYIFDGDMAVTDTVRRKLDAYMENLPELEMQV